MSGAVNEASIACLTSESSKAMKLNVICVFFSVRFSSPERMFLWVCQSKRKRISAKALNCTKRIAAIVNKAQPIRTL